MSIAPMIRGPARTRRRGCVVFASTFWPMRVRLNPIRVVFSVRSREDVAVLAGEELVAREELARELRIVGRQELARVVERVAAEELVAAAEVVVHAPLHEVLVEFLVEREGVNSPAPARATGRSRAGTPPGTARPSGSIVTVSFGRMPLRALSSGTTVETVRPSRSISAS